LNDWDSDLKQTTGQKMKEFRQIVIAGIKTCYSVSNTGEVRNDKTGRTLKQNINTSGYATVNVHGSTQRVHRLVAQAFIIDNPENKPSVNHLDGNKLNNNASNIEYCTPRENWEHALNVLKVPTFGSDENKALITQTQIQRWAQKPNKGIGYFAYGSKSFRVTLCTKDKEQKTIGYFSSFAEAKKAYFDAYKAEFGTLPTGPYAAKLMKNEGRHTKMQKQAA
jgi:hypothetical protein